MRCARASSCAAFSSVPVCSCCCKPVIEAAAPPRIFCTISPVLSCRLTERCTGVARARSCARASLNSRTPSKPSCRAVRMMVGVDTRACAANASTLMDSAFSGFCSSTAITCCCARGSESAMVCSRWSSEGFKWRLQTVFKNSPTQRRSRGSCRRPRASSAICQRWCRGAKCRCRPARRMPAARGRVPVHQSASKRADRSAR